MQIKIDQSYKRLDKFLFQHFETLPLSLLQRLIRKYKIKINNKKSKANSPLIKGDIVYIYHKFEINNDLPNTIKITEDKKKIFKNQIIFQNDDFIVINKIDGYSVQRGSKVFISLKDIYENVIEHKLYIVHRLDKDTSGLMLFAKNRLTASSLADAMNEGHFKTKVIIRTSIGSQRPLHPQHQHVGDFTEAFQKILSYIEIIRLEEPKDIFPAYEKALNRKDGKSTILVEYGDYYNEK